MSDRFGGGDSDEGAVHDRDQGGDGHGDALRNPEGGHQNQESGTVLDVRIARDQGDEEDDNGEDDQDDHEPVHGGGVPVLDLWS